MPTRYLFPLFLSILAACILFARVPEAICAERQQAPDFEFRDLGGAVQKLSDNRGSVVVLNFWATWCPECLVELPSLNAFAEQYRSRGVKVLSVSVDKNESALTGYLRNHPVGFPVMRDLTGDIFVKKYLIHGLPATIIIDRRGLMAAKLLGSQDFQSKAFMQRIDDLLQERP